MALRYGFYNSVGEDRLYDATELSEFFDGIVSDGVLGDVGSAFELTESGADIIVGTGRAWFNKTWTRNDSALTIEMPSSSNINARIDSVVLKIDPRVEGRENSIIIVEGTPSSSPVPPTLSPEVGTYLYRLGNVRRARDSVTITRANITRTVGDPDCPIATSVLTPIEQYSNTNYKRSIVRGNYLGNTMTSAQKAAIRDGSFEGLYLGDYWTFNNTNWRIVDFDYWMHSPGVNATSPIKIHHAVILPDDTRMMFAPTRPFTSARKTSNCGFDFSTASKNRVAAIANQAKLIFGTSGLLRRLVRYNTTLSAPRYAMNHANYYTDAGMPSELMVLGAHNLGLPVGTHEYGQLALYKNDFRNFWMGQDQGLVTRPSGTAEYGPTWLQNQYTVDNWVAVLNTGLGASNPSNAANGTTYQLRPVFGITGR